MPQGLQVRKEIKDFRDHLELLELPDHKVYKELREYKGPLDL